MGLSAVESLLEEALSVGMVAHATPGGIVVEGLKTVYSRQGLRCIITRRRNECAGENARLSAAMKAADKLERQPAVAATPAASAPSALACLIAWALGGVEASRVSPGRFYAAAKAAQRPTAGAKLDTTSALYAVRGVLMSVQRGTMSLVEGQWALWSLAEAGKLRQDPSVEACLQASIAR